jgi:hypothetical protein
LNVGTKDACNKFGCIFVSNIILGHKQAMRKYILGGGNQGKSILRGIVWSALIGRAF